MANDTHAEPDLSRRAVLGTLTASSVGLAGCTAGFECDAGIEMTAQSPFQYGSQGTYEIRIYNGAAMFGSCSGEIAVEDPLPPGITFDSVNGNWTASVSGGVVTATNDSYGGLSPGESVTLELTVDVASASGFPASPPVQNCATATLGGDPVGITATDYNCVTHEFSGQTQDPTPTDTPTDAPTDTPTDRPTDTQTETPTDTPTERPTDTSTARPTDTQTANQTDRPTTTSTDTQTAVPTQTSQNDTDSSTNRTS